MLIALFSFLDTILSYFNISTAIFSYLTTALFISFLYLSSHVFRFCSYHRMFIHYIVLEIIINGIDYHYGIPLGLKEMVTIQSIILGLFLFIILYLKFKVCKPH